jgi:hypothetical protein
LPGENHADEAAPLYALISFPPQPDPSLLDLARLLTDLDEVYKTMAQFVYFDAMASENAAEVPRPLDEVERPKVVVISRDSPLILQLMAGAAAVPSLRAFVAVLRDPEKLGSYIPKVKSAYYDAAAEEHKARERLDKLRAGKEIKVKEARHQIKIKQRQRVKKGDKIKLYNL